MFPDETDLYSLQMHVNMLIAYKRMVKSMKAGYKTTEFLGVLITAVPTVLTLLVMFGVIGQIDVETLRDAVIGGLTAVGGFIANAVVIWKYIESRTRVKEAAYSSGIEPA